MCRQWKTAQVVAVPEALIRIPHLPVTGCRYAVQETAVVQYREVETRAVPRDQVRRVFLQAVEKTLDQILLRRAFVSEAPYSQRFPRAHHHGNGNDALLLVRQEFASCLLAALRKHDLRHVLIGQGRANHRDACQDWYPARSQCRTPTCSSGLAAHENRDCHHQAGFIGQGHMALAYAKTIANLGAARRIHHLGFCPMSFARCRRHGSTRHARSPCPCP